MRGYLIRIAILAIVLSGAGTARATVPTTMNVQGRLTDDTGSPLPAGFKQMTFKIFDSETGGAEIWSEGTQLVTSDANGLWNADVGANTPLSPSVFADTMRWLEITVNDGVNPSETLPRVRLDTSPYAFQANESMHSATTDTAAHAAHAAYADTAGLSLTVTPDDDWTVSDSLIETTYQRGIVRGGSDNFHYGSNAQTIVNMGVACTTSFDGAGSPNVTIGGGFHNVAKRHWSTISGGRDNVAVGTGSTVSGGYVNSAGGTHSTVSGGDHNGANAEQASVLGGGYNLAGESYSTVGGGVYDSANGAAATVAGGFNNTASGNFAMIPGGDHNDAIGNYSFAGGRRAIARGEGSFVWADATDEDFDVGATNQFRIRASGGVGIGTHFVNGWKLFVGGTTRIEIPTGSPNALSIYCPEFQNGFFSSWQTSSDLTVAGTMQYLGIGSNSDPDCKYIECQRSGGDVDFVVYGDGDVNADGVISGGGADLAEIVPVSARVHSVSPGDVMAIDPDNPQSLVLSSTPRSTLVSGVYSTRPGFVASEHDWDQVALDRGLVRLASADSEQVRLPALDVAKEIGEIPLAVVGIVPCKVSAENGPIHPGNLLVTSSTPGRAMRDDHPAVGTVLGKAMGSLETGTGTIDVLVTLQ